MSADPMRLLEDPATADALRADLQVAADAHVAGFDAAGGLAQLQASIGTQTAPTVAGAGTVTGVKIAAATVVVAAVAWFGLRSSDDAPDANGPANPAIVATAEPAPAEPASPAVDHAVPGERIDQVPVADGLAHPDEVPAETVPVADEAEPPPAPVPEHPAEKTTPRTVAPPAAASTIDVDSVLEEAKRVKQARRALDDDPALALRRTEALADDFPSGQLVEERRAIQIRALAALGRMDEARTQAEAFLRHYGRGPHAAAVRRAIDAPDP
jgi:hypothetical protein